MQKEKSGSFSTKATKMPTGLFSPTVLWLSAKERGVSTMDKDGYGFVGKTSDRFGSSQSN